MNMKTIKKMAAVAILTAAVMTACGGSAEKSSARQAQENSTQAETLAAEVSENIPELLSIVQRFIEQYTYDTYTADKTYGVSRIFTAIAEKREWEEMVVVNGEGVEIKYTISEENDLIVRSEFQVNLGVEEFRLSEPNKLHITSYGVMEEKGEELVRVYEFDPQTGNFNFTAPQAETQPASDVSPSVMFVNSTNTGHLNMRTQPNAESNHIVTLPQGAQVNVFSDGAVGNWVRVSYQIGNVTREGFVSRNFLSDTPPPINRDSRLVNRDGEVWSETTDCTERCCRYLSFSSDGSFVYYVAESDERSGGTWRTVGNNLVLEWTHPYIREDAIIKIYSIDPSGDRFSARHNWLRNSNEYHEFYERVRCN